MAKQTVYSVTAVNEALSQLFELGYDCYQLDEGSLGIGEWYCIAPDEYHYNIHIKEVYLNCWSSGQTLRKYRKVPASWWKRIDAIGYQPPEE